MQNLLENSSRCVSHSPSRVKAEAFKTDVKSSVTESRAQFLKVYWYCDIFPSIVFRYSGWFLESSSIIPLIPHACFFFLFFGLWSLVLAERETGAALNIAAPQTTLDHFCSTGSGLDFVCVWLYNFSCCENFHPLTKSPSWSSVLCLHLFSTDGPPLWEMKPQLGQTVFITNKVRNFWSLPHVVLLFSSTICACC